MSKNIEKLLGDVMEVLSEIIEMEEGKEEPTEEAKDEQEEEKEPWYEWIWNELHTDERQREAVRNCSFNKTMFECIDANLNTCKRVHMVYFDKDFNKIYFFDNGLISYNGKDLVCESLDANLKEFAEAKYSYVNFID